MTSFETLGKQLLAKPLGGLSLPQSPKTQDKRVTVLFRSCYQFEAARLESTLPVYERRIINEIIIRRGGTYLVLMGTLEDALFYVVSFLPLFLPTQRATGGLRCTEGENAEEFGRFASDGAVCTGFSMLYA
jgi:hypothetical protein